MKASEDQAAAGPPAAQLEIAIQARNSTKVTWTRMAVPAIEPIVTDQSMRASVGYRQYGNIGARQEPRTLIDDNCGWNFVGHRPLSRVAREFEESDDGRRQRHRSRM